MNNAIILTQIRSGTQMLLSALQSHSQVNICSWPDSSDNKWAFLDSFIAQCGKTNIVVCHQWSSGHLRQTLDIDQELFYSHIGARFQKIILLNRVNRLRSFLSFKIAAQSVFAVNEPRKEEIKVTIDLPEFLSFVTSTWVLRREIEGYFAEKSVKSLSYEDLIKNWGKANKDIQKYVGLKRERIQPTTYRQEYRKIRDIVTNYKDLSKFLHDFHWEAWLEDEI